MTCISIFTIFAENLVMEKEIWKDIEGYEGLYQVSNLGNVKSLNYNKTKIERILKPFKVKNGYLYVQLYKNGKRKKNTVQRLVADAFIPNPENKPEVNHKNEIKTDNRSSNLEWCERRYNNNYGTRNERVSKKLSKKVLCVENGIIYQSTREAERQTGIGNGNISKCCNEKQKTAGEFHWQFV